MTYRSGVGAAGHVVMMTPSLVRNRLRSHRVVLDGGGLAGTGAPPYSFTK